MKTVIDAVNTLNGDLEFANQGDSGYPYLLVDIHNGSYWLSGMGKSAIESGKLYNYICTVDEFNACVYELSAATWIDGVSLEEWKAGMKNTVIDSHGNELELNKVYEFSDNARVWFASSIVLLVNSEYQYKTQNTSWRFIRECQLPLGTIKKAPVKLVDGKAYQFDCAYETILGFYDENRDGFEVAGKLCMAKYCKNIIPLAPETK